MYKIQFDHPIHVHFIGIGGISMSGLAELLAEKGFQVSGSDNSESELTRALSGRGVQVFYGQRAENIIPGIDLVVYTAAIQEDNPELSAARKAGLPIIPRAELLGQVMDNYADSIAVAGTHGKTTTTSMISSVLLAAKADPTISVGGILPAIGANIRVGSSDSFVCEACEYTNSFLHFHPRYNIILNVEEDHMDFFKDIDDIRHSFRLFAENTKADGTLILGRDIDSYEELAEGLPCRMATFGIHKDNYKADGTDLPAECEDSLRAFDNSCSTVSSDSRADGCLTDCESLRSVTDDSCSTVSSDSRAEGSLTDCEDSRRLLENDYWAGGISYDDHGCASFHAYRCGTELGAIALSVPGEHNVLNAIAAIACCDCAGIPFEPMREGLESFHGADRRFQYKGTVDGVTIIDDYSHHPTEIRAALRAAQNYPHKRIVVVFQPHTYSRTKAFLNDFADALSLADVVVLADIYAAREKNTYGISSRDLLDRLKEKQAECFYLPSFEEIEKFLLKNCINGDLLITMGAGNVVDIGEHLLGR